MVPPLFDEITNSVVSGFASAKMARTRTGESESNVLNVIFDESGLLYFVMVMGRLRGAALANEHDRLSALGAE